MKLVLPIARQALPITLAAVLALGVAWSTTHPAVASPSTNAIAGDTVNPTIQQAMHQMNDALKAIGKGVTAETRVLALVEISKFEAAVITAKTETPETAAKVDEKKRAAFVNDFKKSLVEELKFACDAETAILDGKYKDADALIHNKMESLKSAGHSKFKGEAGK